MFYIGQIVWKSLSRPAPEYGHAGLGTKAWQRWLPVVITGHIRAVYRMALSCYRQSWCWLFGSFI